MVPFLEIGWVPKVKSNIRGQIAFGKDLENGISSDFFTRIHPPGDTTSGSIIPPNEKTGYTTGFSAATVSPGDYAFIMENDEALILLVHLEYFDTAGNLYHSEVCRLRLQSGAITSCKTHNRIY